MKICFSLSNVIVSLFPILLSSPQALGSALNSPAPINKIQCSAGIFSLAAKLPTEDIQPFTFSLSGDEDSHVWNVKIEKIILKDQYKSFYSRLWISQSMLSKFSTKAILSQDPLENGYLSFTLSRFSQTEKRVAGISLEVNLARGYYAAYLIDFKNDGYTKKILSPFTVDNEDFALSVSCDVESLPLSSFQN